MPKLKTIALGFVLLLLISIIVTSEKEKHAQDADANAKNCVSAAVASVDRPQAEKDCANAQRYTPGWEAAVAFRVFGWPEGITAWALFATLAAIGWQSHETRRSAAATEKAAIATEKAATATEKSVAVARRQIDMLKDKERARIELLPQGLKLEMFAPYWNVSSFLRIRNLGITRAHITRFQAALFHFEKGDEEPIPSIYGQGNIFPDSYIDPTEDWSKEAPSQLYIFKTDSIALDWFCAGVYDGSIRVLIRAEIEYGTMGTKYKRICCFEWMGTGRADSFARFLAGDPPTTNEGKIAAGVWKTDSNIEYEIEEPDNPN